MRALFAILLLFPTTSLAHPAVGTVFSERGQCVGTLISRRHVVTAAHCVSGLITPITFEAEQLWSQEGQTGSVEAVVVHRDWNVFEKNPVTRAAADFAVLHLAQPVRRAAFLPLAEGFPDRLIGKEERACGPMIPLGGDVALAPCEVAEGQSGTAAVLDGKLVGIVVARTTFDAAPGAVIHLISMENADLF